MAKMTEAEFQTLQNSLTQLLKNNIKGDTVQDARAFLAALMAYVEDQENFKLNSKEVICLLQQTNTKGNHLGLHIAQCPDEKTLIQYLNLLLKFINSANNKESTDPIAVLLNYRNSQNNCLGHFITHKNDVATGLYLNILDCLIPSSPDSHPSPPIHLICMILYSINNNRDSQGHLIARYQNSKLMQQYLNLLIRIATTFPTNAYWVADMLKYEVKGWHLGNLLAYYHDQPCQETYLQLLEILAPSEPLRVFDILVQEISSTPLDLQERILPHHGLVNTTAILINKGCNTSSPLLTRYQDILAKTLSTEFKPFFNVTPCEAIERSHYKSYVMNYLGSLPDDAKTLELLKSHSKPKTLLAQFCKYPTTTGLTIWLHNKCHSQDQHDSMMALYVSQRITKIEGQMQQNGQEAPSFKQQEPDTSNHAPAISTSAAPSGGNNRPLATAQASMTKSNLNHGVNLSQRSLNPYNLFEEL